MANQRSSNQTSTDVRDQGSRDRRGRRQETQSIKQFLVKARNASFEDLDDDIDEFEKCLPTEDY